MASVKHISEDDFLNDGRVKINEFAIDPANRAEVNSKQAITDANKLGNEAKKTAKELGNKSVQISNEKGDESIRIAKEKGDISIQVSNEKGDKSLEIAKEAKNQSEKTSNEVREMIKEQDLNPEKDLEIVQSRGCFETLPTRLDDISQKSNLAFNSFLDIPNVNNIYDLGVKDYFVESLKKFKESIDTDLINIGWNTDSHYEEKDDTYVYAKNSYSHVDNIIFLSDKLDAIIFGGDNVNSDERPIQKAIKRVNDFCFNAFYKSKCPVFFTEGNHDDGSFMQSDDNDNIHISDVMKKEYRKKAYRTKEKLFNENRYGNSFYFYKDVKNVRIIVLDSYDFDYQGRTDKNGFLEYKQLIHSTYSQDQLDWLVKEALNIDDGKHVIIFQHASITTATTNAIMHNNKQIEGILNAFASGSYFVNKNEDGVFSTNVDCSFSKKGNLVALIHGHLHRDIQEKKENFIEIGTTCSVCPNNFKGREVGKVEEEALSVFEIDTENRTLNMRRFGFGSNLKINY